MAIINDADSSESDDDLLHASLELAFGSSASAKDAAPSEPSSNFGEWIDGRYHLLEELGRGGMGCVYRAHDAELERDVALKLLLPDVIAGHFSLQRFTDEAQVCAQLQHPGIVPVYDAGLDERGRPWFTMRIVEGRTLREELASRDSLVGIDGPVAAFEAICHAVASAHDRRVIHRDLKPSNVMLGPFGETLVLDWGLAKVIGTSSALDGRPSVRTVRAESDSMASSSGTVIGTPGYMAPEQARGEVETLDERADVFALGAILCEILTGGHAFFGAPDMRAAARDGDLRLAFERLAAVEDQELAALARDCLAPEAARRLADAAAVASRVGAWRAAREDRRRQAERAAGEAAARVHHERRVWKRTLFAILAGVVALSIVAVALGLRWVEERRRVEETSGRVLGLVGETRSLLEAAASLTDDAAAFHQVERAIERVGRARALMASQSVDDEVARAVSEVATRATSQQVELSNQMEAARRGARFRERLTEVDQQLLEERRLANRLALVDAALREYGIDVSSEDAAEAIRDSRERDRVILALNDWIRAPLFGGSSQWTERTRQVRELVEALDEDPFRRRLRRASFDRDLDALAALATDQELLGLPPSTIRLVADALVEHGLLVEAERLLRNARRQHEGSLSLNQRLAMVCHELDKFEDAVAFGRAAEALSPGVGGGYLLCVDLVKTGRLEEAESLARRMKQVRDDLPTRMTAILVAQERGDQAAMTALARGLASDFPNNPWAQLASGRVFNVLKMKSAATESLQRGVGLADDVHLLSLLGESLVFAGSEEEGLSVLKRVVEKEPLSPVATKSYAVLLFKAGRMKECVAIMERALPLNPTDYRLHYQQGLALSRVARLADAEAAINTALSLAKTERERSEASLAIEGCRQASEVLRRIEAVVAGKRLPEERAEWSELITYARSFQLFAEESDLWHLLRENRGELFATLPSESRIDAIVAALRGGLGQGSRDAQPARLRALRDRGLAWLREEVTAVSGPAPSDARRREALLEALEECVPLQHLRKNAAKHLADDEQAPWRQLFESIDALEELD